MSCAHDEVGKLNSIKILSVARQCCMDRLKASGLLVDRKAIGFDPIPDIAPIGPVRCTFGIRLPSMSPMLSEPTSAVSDGNGDMYQRT